MRAFLALVLLAACVPPPAPPPSDAAPSDLELLDRVTGPKATCFALCDSDAVCSAPPSQCNFCNRGLCDRVAFNPSPPLPDDAGVDAPPDAH